jgi:phosphoglycerol transferase
VGGAFALAALGVLDQVPRQPSAAARAEIARAVQGDAHLVRELEAALPRGAMVFQLPVLGFPETAPPFRMSDYDLFRPYLHSDTLRFSYGAAKFRARSRWQRDLENLPAESLVRRLESYGFAALYLNRKGFQDRADRLLAQLERLGYDRRIVGASGYQVAVLLHPAPHPVKPLGRTVTFGRGWQARTEDGIRWANEATAVISYFNPYSHPLHADLRLEFEPVQATHVSLVRGHEVLGRTALETGRATLELTRMTLEPGVNVFHLQSEKPAVRLGNGRYQLRAFGLAASAIRVAGLEAGGLVARSDSD